MERGGFAFPTAPIKDTFIVMSNFKKNSSSRSRNFELMTYISEDELLNYCNSSFIDKFAFALHDKDTFCSNDSSVIDGKHSVGDFKEPHYHCVLVYHNARTLSAVLKDFKQFSQNTFVYFVGDLSERIDYLIHKRDKDKYQYSEDIVVSNFDSLFNHKDRDNVAYNILCDILEYKSMRYLAKKYGRDLILNYSRYKEFATDMRIEETKNKIVNDIVFEQVNMKLPF